MKKTSQGGEGRKQSRIYRLAGLTLPDDVGEDAALLQGEKQRNMMKPPIAAYTLDEINCGEEEEQEEKEQEEEEQQEKEEKEKEEQEALSGLEIMIYHFSLKSRTLLSIQIHVRQNNNKKYAINTVDKVKETKHSPIPKFPK